MKNREIKQTKIDSEDLMSKVVALCKRRGFIFQGSEIYGGLANTWDYGPYGTALKNNIKQSWWKHFVQERTDIVGLDSSILMHPKTWEASGHIQSFSDPLIDCKKCKERFRGDKIIEEHLGIEKATGKTLKEVSKIIHKHKLPCPKCGASDFTEAREFNLMFRTHQGVLEEEASLVYLRPETAQGIFVNFRNITQIMRKKIPFGVAQIGKAFRNEITPGNFTYRTREFEMMEIEYFIKPIGWEKFFSQWEKLCEEWFKKLGINKANLRTREHDKKELAHYSKKTIDIEYKFPFGWGELMGVAYRTDFDLKKHMEFSGADLTYFDQEANEKFIPHVIEPSFGVDRTVLTVLADAYAEDTISGEPRVVMKLDPSIAPVQAAIFPLIKDKKLIKISRAIFDDLKTVFKLEYDEGGSIGKRYRRQDEIGTPYCLTIDFDTLTDKCVTIRDRDTTKQKRVKIEEIATVLKDL